MELQQKETSKIQPTDNSIDRINSSQADLLALEVAASSASSSPGALSTSMLVAAEARLEKFMIHSVRTEVSVGGRKHRKNTYPEATGTSILIAGKVFRSFEGLTLGCLATFSDGSGVEVRVRF